MNIPGLQQAVGRFISDNASTILTAGGVIGTVLTATLAAKAGGSAMLRIDMKEREDFWLARAVAEEDSNDPLTDAELEELTQANKLSKVEKLKIAAPLFIPPVIIGTLTVASIVMSNQISAKRAAALAGAYALSEQRWADYKERVEQKLTKPKREQLETEIAEDRMNVNPPTAQEIILVGSGEVLCYDMYSDRYFNSTAEKIRAGQNKINEELFQSQYASLSAFYDYVGLPPTGFSNDVGWNMATTGACEVRITAHKSPDDKPCLAFDFVVPPRPEYVQNY
jgi:hypothetical protein